MKQNQYTASLHWRCAIANLLHGLADRYFDGDLGAAQRRLRRNGLARQDPYPGNGAWPEYRAIGE